MDQIIYIWLAITFNSHQINQLNGLPDSPLHRHSNIGPFGLGSRKSAHLLNIIDIKKLNEKTQRKWASIRSNITGRKKKQPETLLGDEILRTWKSGLLQIRYEIFMNVERIYREIYMHIDWVSERDMLRILTYSQVVWYIYAVANGNYERYNRFKRQILKREKLPTGCVRFRFLVSITWT